MKAYISRSYVEFLKTIIIIYFLFQVALQEAVCVEEFSTCKALGRVFLRALGRTIAVGVVTRVIEEPLE